MAIRAFIFRGGTNRHVRRQGTSARRLSENGGRSERMRGRAENPAGIRVRAVGHPFSDSLLASSSLEIPARMSVSGIHERGIWRFRRAGRLHHRAVTGAHRHGDDWPSRPDAGPPRLVPGCFFPLYTRRISVFGFWTGTVLLWERHLAAICVEHDGSRREAAPTENGHSMCSGCNNSHFIQIEKTMNTMQIQRNPGPRRPNAGALQAFSASILLLLAGCSSVNEGKSGFFQVTVKPGQTANCDSTPCKIMLEMPAGSGTFEVTGNQVKLGDYPAGQTVEVGSFWTPQAINIKGTDAPTAHVYMPSEY